MINIKEYAESLDSLILNRNNEHSMTDMMDNLAQCQFIILSLYRKNQELMDTINKSISLCDEMNFVA